MTVDEELALLDDNLRRLKVEYDVYFGGGAKRPPTDLEWRVQSLLNKYSDTQRLNFGQRFKYNTLAQKYSVFASLWRQKVRIKEEGYRRPEDAWLSIQGLRTEEEHAATQELKSRGKKKAANPAEFVVDGSGSAGEQESVRRLFDAMLEAKRRVGEEAQAGKFDGFMAFVKLKTDQIRSQYKCKRVEYRVEVKGKKVNLKAKPV